MNSINEGMAKEISAHAPFEAVALVASAGGVEAISTLVRHLPADFPAAVIVVLHLGPGKNHLIEILARISKLPVQWAMRYEPFQPGRVYLCPPRQVLLVQPDRTGDLEPYEMITRARPISAFLQSLAESYGPRALAVILTGMWRDGVEGVQAIKANGGMVLVQSERSATHPEMPRAAIETGIVDLVLPLQELAHTIPGAVAGARLPRSYTEIEAVSLLFRNEDETSTHLREMEWEHTAFGPVSRWPISLSAIVCLMMDTNIAMALLWGPETRLLYNDVYRPLLGSQHPQAIGLPAHEVYRENWQQLAPMYQQVMTSGQPLHQNDQRWSTQRNGRVEDMYAICDYTPIRDERGSVCGVLLTVIDTTRQVLAERRAATLRHLIAMGLRIHTEHEVCEQAVQILERNPDDIPFALLYLLDPLRLTLRLGGASGALAGTVIAPHLVSLSEGHPIWTLAAVLEQGKPLLLNDLSTRIRECFLMPEEKWPSSAILLPLKAVTETHSLGVLIIGLSLRGIFDTPYREFLEIVAAQIATGLATAHTAQRDAERMEALTALDRAKTDFFSNVSHEFRTPLTLLLGPLENVLKQQEQLPPTVQDDLLLVQRNATQLYKLVNTLLDFSRIEARRATLKREPTDLAALTRDLASLFRSAVEQAGLSFIVDCPPLPHPVPVDREMWEKIVLNLLSNALKYTFSGSISLTLRALPQHIELVVADTGVGIPQEQQPHLFQRFHRIAEVHGRTQQGTGIGLALVQEYTRLHGGRVRVRSHVGEGTTFTVWLPLTPPALGGLRDQAPDPSAIITGATTEAQLYADEAVRWVQKETEVPAASDVLEGDVVDGQTPLPLFAPRARVLVVEDHADMRTYLQRLLSQQWQIQVATNGREALEQAHSDPPDLILADVMMPEVDGFALLRHVRKDEHLRTTPFLLMTARAGEEAAIEGLLAGADDYVIKPFSARELLARISAQLELSRVRQEGEKRVQAERQRLYDMLMQAPLSIAVVRGPDYVYELANPLTLQLLGTNRPIVGKSFLEAVPEMEGQVFLDLLNSVYRTGKPFIGHEIPAQIDRNNDGTLEQHYMNFVYQPFYNADGEIDSLIAFAYDVTETVLTRQQAQENEERLRALANSLPQLVWSANAEGEIDFFNERLHEYAEIPVDKNGVYLWQTIVHPEQRAALLHPWERVIQAGSSFELEYRLHMQDGRYRWHLVRGVPTHDANGTLSRWYGTMTDIEQFK